MVLRLTVNLLFGPQAPEGPDDSGNPSQSRGPLT